MAPADAQHGAGGSEELAIATNIGQPANSDRPLPHFTFPRELRDRIYAYLLHHENVHEKPYHTREQSARGKASEANVREDSTAHTYRFHTNILAVNRQLHKEASQVLASNNFVVFSYLCKGFGKVLHRFGIPIVTENNAHLAKFKGHVLCVQYRAPGNFHANARKLQSVLIVAKDLPQICTLLKAIYALMPSPANHVYHDPNDPPQVISNFRMTDGYPVSQKASLKLLVKSPKFVDLDSTSVKALLEPFRTVVFGMQDVEFVNLDEELTAYAEELQRIMGPRSVWVNALAWQTLELVREVKEQGDVLVVSGDLAGAANLYATNWKMSGFAASCPLLDLSSDAYTSEVTAIIAQIHVVLIACGIMDNLIRMSQGTIDCQTALQRAEVLRAREENVIFELGQENSISANLRNVITWNVMLNCFLFDGLDSTVQSGVERFRKHIEDENGPMKKYFVHDMTTMESFIGKRLISGKDSDECDEKLLCKHLSVSHLGIPLIKEDFSLLTKPSHFCGLVDQDHLAALQAADPKLAARVLRGDKKKD